MSLADDQAALVAALVAGGALPDGFDAERVRVAREALLRKRSDEVAAAWPVLAASIGPQWTVGFRAWARDRPPNGSYLDGLEFARFLDRAGRLPEAARDELVARSGRATWVRRWWRSTRRHW